MPLFLATSTPPDLPLPLTQAPQLSRLSLSHVEGSDVCYKQALSPLGLAASSHMELPKVMSSSSLSVHGGLWGTARPQRGRAYLHPECHLLVVILAPWAGACYSSQGHCKVVLWLSELVIGSNWGSQHSFFFGWWFLYQPFVACGRSAMTVTKALSLNWYYLFSLKLT